jgi:hypothetical protein
VRRDRDPPERPLLLPPPSSPRLSFFARSPAGLLSTELQLDYFFIFLRHKMQNESSNMSSDLDSDHHTENHDTNTQKSSHRLIFGM